MLDLFFQTVKFALPVLITIFLGLFFAGILVELGLLSPISHLARPIVSVAHLPEICASSFVVSLGSTVAANSMVARFMHDESLENREVFLCTMINSIPAYIREIFTYQIPVVLPALGIFAGSLYASVFMVTALVKIVVVVILGRVFFQPRSYGAAASSPHKNVSLSQAFFKVIHSQKRVFLRIASVYIVVTFLIFLLRDQGVFESLGILPLAGLFGIPPESMVPLTTYVASPILGISMLGPMIRGGSISEIQAMIVLMLGSMFMLPVFAVRSMVPNYTALFGPRLGLSVVAFSTGISILVRLAFLLAFLRIG